MAKAIVFRSDEAATRKNLGSSPANSTLIDFSTTIIVRLTRSGRTSCVRGMGMNRINEGLRNLNLCGGIRVLAYVHTDLIDGHCFPYDSSYIIRRIRDFKGPERYPYTVRTIDNDET